MRISDWSSDVCSSDLRKRSMPFARPMPIMCSLSDGRRFAGGNSRPLHMDRSSVTTPHPYLASVDAESSPGPSWPMNRSRLAHCSGSTMASISAPYWSRSEEHTTELQSLMRTSYSVLCLKKKTTVELDIKGTHILK